mgnify:CR=1 FL=1
MSKDSPVETKALSDVTEVLIRALREVGKSGKPDQANRLAARAWLALRTEHPREAQQINGLMHFLARLPENDTEQIGTSHLQENA